MCPLIEFIFHNLIKKRHLVEGDDVDAAAEADVLGVKAVDAPLLEALLGVRVVGRDGGRQNRRHHERQDVQTVQQDLFDGALGSIL